MQVRNGDLDALGVLFERYHHRLFGFFYRLTLQRDVSADLVQDVFERILRYRSSYTGDGEFSTWLFRIARNRHSDYHRQMEKESSVVTQISAAKTGDASSGNTNHDVTDRPRHDAMADGSVTYAAAGPVHADKLASRADEGAIDNRLLLDQALRRLDPEKKQALILSRVEGFLYREIAEITGCTEGAVKVRVFRGLQELRRVMDGLQRDGAKRIQPKTGRIHPGTKPSQPGTGPIQPDDGPRA